MTTIFEALRHDHDEQRRLLERVAATEGDSEERRELFEQLRVELEAHAAIEERVFYSVRAERQNIAMAELLEKEKRKAVAERS